MKDKSFLDAPYIRVVNHGVGGWNGDQISLTVDGQDILKNVKMLHPDPNDPKSRHLGDPNKGFQNFNPKNWSGRSYWQGDLPKLRETSARSKY